MAPPHSRSPRPDSQFEDFKMDCNIKSTSELTSNIHGSPLNQANALSSSESLDITAIQDNNMSGFNSDRMGNWRDRTAGDSRPDVLVSSVVPGPAWPDGNQLDCAYAYAIQRDDGTLTQLIPLDELNSINLNKISLRQGPENLIILPPPRLLRPENRTGPDSFVPRAVRYSHFRFQYCLELL
jgi:hypothetical protein